MCHDSDYMAWRKGDMMFRVTESDLISFDAYFDEFIARYIKELDEDGNSKGREDILLQVVNLDRLIARDVWDRIAAIKSSADYEEYEKELDSDADFTPEGFFENFLRLDGLQSYDFFMHDDDYEHHFESQLDTTAGTIHAFGYAGYD